MKNNYYNLLIIAVSVIIAFSGIYFFLPDFRYLRIEKNNTVDKNIMKTESKYFIDTEKYSNTELMNKVEEISKLIYSNPKEAKNLFVNSKSEMDSLVKNHDDKILLKMLEYNLYRNQPLREDAAQSIQIANDLFHDQMLIPQERARFGVALINVPQGDKELRKIAISGPLFSTIRISDNEVDEFYEVCKVVVSIYAIGRCQSFILAMDAYRIFENLNSNKINIAVAKIKAKKIEEKLYLLEDEIKKEASDTFADRINYPNTLNQRNNAYGALSAAGLVEDEKKYMDKFEESVLAIKQDPYLNDKNERTYLLFMYMRYLIALANNGDFEKAKEILNILLDKNGVFHKMNTLYAMPKNFLEHGHYYEKAGINAMIKNVPEFKALMQKF